MYLLTLSPVSGGMTLPDGIDECIDTYFEKPILGYTKTFIGWTLTDYQSDAQKAPRFEYACYTALYNFEPIYA